MTNCDVISSRVQKKCISEDRKTNARSQMIKNFIVLCLALHFLYIPLSSFSVLESTMNQHEGRGVASLAIYLGFMAISSLTISKYIVIKLGYKKCLLFSVIGCTLYIISHFYFVWIVIIPASILTGISASVFWTAACIYINQLAINHCYFTVGANNNLHNTGSANKHENNVGNSESKNESEAVAHFHKTEEERKQCECRDCDQIQNCETNSQLNTVSQKVSFSFSYNNFKERSVNKFMRNVYTVNKCNMNNDNDKPRSDKYNILCRADVVLQSINPEDLVSVRQSEKYKEYISWVTALLFGIFEFFYRSADAWGTLIAYFIMKNERTVDIKIENDNCTCGSLFCNSESMCFENNLAEPSQEVKNVITGIFFGMAVVSVLILSIFLDRLKRGKEPAKFSFDFLLGTCKFVSKKEALLLIPMSVSSGLLDGFYLTDYTKSYVACSWGVHHVGLVSISYGLLAGFSSPLSGWLVKHVGRIAVILVGNMLGVTGCIFCLLWTPNANEPWILFIGAGIWGSALGILSSQTKAYYGVLFDKDEVAFAACWMWISVGLSLSFAYSNHLCTYVKIYTLLFLLLIGTVGYLKTESFCSRNTETHL